MHLIPKIYFSVSLKNTNVLRKNDKDRYTRMNRFFGTLKQKGTKTTEEEKSTKLVAESGSLFMVNCLDPRVHRV